MPTIDRGGAGGTIATRAVARSAPDGHTILLGYTGTLAINPSLYANPGYDPRKDFAPIGLIGELSSVLVVHPSLPVRSVAEVIAFAKARPGRIDYAFVPGTVGHITTELFANIAGIEITRIPYKGNGPALTDLIGGHVSMMFLSILPILEHVRAGEPLDAEREYVAVEAERQKGEGRGSHSWAAKKRHRDSVVHLLVGEQAQMHASMERRNRAPRGDGSLRDELVAVPAQTRDQAVDQRVVGGAVDLSDRDPVLDAGKRADLPIGDMTGKDDHPPPGSNRPVDMLEAVRLDASAWLEDADFLEVRVFCRDAAEVVPHTGNDARDFSLGKLGKSAAKIASRALGDAEKRPDAARERAAKGGGPIEREQAKDGEEKCRSPGFQAMGEADPPAATPTSALTRLALLGTLSRGAGEGGRSPQG